MTAFPWNSATDELEHSGFAGEPSHLHIPRPSRARRGHVLDHCREEVAPQPAQPDSLTE
jgi:hypothetical protein